MAGTGTATIDFGATPVDGKVFTVTDAAIGSGSYVEAFVMHGDTTADNDASAHEMAAASWRLSCKPASGSFELIVHNLFWLCTGQFKIRYAWS